MARGFKIFGLILLTFLVVWAVVIVQWQQTHRLPDTSDIVLYLIALPIGLLLVFLMLKLGIDRLRRPPAADAAPPADPQAAAAEQAQAAQARERTLSARILIQAVNLPVGADAAAAIEALRDPGTQPELDKQIKNADGFPVAAARIADLAPDDEALREELDALSPGLDWQPTSVRAIAALEPVLMQAFDAINAALPEPPSDPAPRARRPEPLALRITTFVNERMPEHERQLLVRWITQRCVNTIDERRARAQVSALPVRNGTDALLTLDRWILNAHKREEPELLLALATDSSIDQDAVDRLAATGALFGADNANGRVPGEAAAALAIARAELPLLWPDADVRLHRIGLGKRDKSADASGRIAADLHTTLVRQCLEIAQVQAADIKLVYTDADHRASRGVELGALMNELLPELDPIQDRCALGVGCGDTGAAAGLATLALAAGALVENEAPALVLSSFDAFERAATLVRRQPQPEPVAT